MAAFLAQIGNIDPFAATPIGGLVSDVNIWCLALDLRVSISRCVLRVGLCSVAAAAQWSGSGVAHPVRQHVGGLVGSERLAPALALQAVLAGSRRRQDVAAARLSCAAGVFGRSSGDGVVCRPNSVEAARMGSEDRVGREGLGDKRLTISVGPLVRQQGSRFR